METQNEADYYKVELAKALFPSSQKDRDNATWEEILDVVQVCLEHLKSIEGVIAQIEKDNSCNRTLLNRAPEDALDTIRDQLNEYQEQVEELDDQKAEIEQEFSEFSESLATQQKGAEEVLGDLGFDVYRLAPGITSIDFTKPGLVEEMKRQMENMK